MTELEEMDAAATDLMTNAPDWPHGHVFLIMPEGADPNARVPLDRAAFDALLETVSGVIAAAGFARTDHDDLAARREFVGDLGRGKRRAVIPTFRPGFAPGSGVAVFWFHDPPPLPSLRTPAFATNEEPELRGEFLTVRLRWPAPNVPAGPVVLSRMPVL